MMSDQRLPAPLQQANDGLPLPIHQHQDRKIDTDKLLFWKVAKKIAQQRRREENSVVMKYQQQHQERKQPINVPTEICGGGGASTHASASIRLRQQKDAAWLFAPTTTEDDLVIPNDPLSHAKKDSSTGNSFHKDDNDDDSDDDDMSCVSDVTRELQDIDAPALYPSLACLEQVLPDIQVSQGQTGKIAVSSSKNAQTDKSASLHSLSSSYFLEEEDEDALDMHWTPPTTLGGIVAEKKTVKRSSKDTTESHKAKKAMEEEYDFSNLMMPNSSIMKKGGHAWNNKDSNCRGRSREESTVLAASKKGTRHTSETSLKPPQRRLSLGSKNQDDEKDVMFILARGRMSSDNALTRKVSSTSPVPPQRQVSRKFSLDSHFSNSLVDLMTQQMRKNSMSRTSDRINKGIMDLQPSTESPVPPQRRHSIEGSHVSGMDFLRCHQKAAKATDVEMANNSARTPFSATWEELSYGGSHCGGNGKEQAPSQAFKDDTPSRQELGYDEENDEVHDFAAPKNNHLSPNLPLRQASFTSFLDDNSTIATETLGLYRRRKSIDSSVAAPLYSNRLPDAPPSRPKRRRSTSSTVQGPFPSSSMARFASIERVQPGSLWAVDVLERTRRLTKIELDKL